MKEDMTVNKDVMVIQNSAGRTALQESPAQSYPVGMTSTFLAEFGHYRSPWLAVNE